MPVANNSAASIIADSFAVALESAKSLPDAVETLVLVTARECSSVTAMGGRSRPRDLAKGAAEALWHWVEASPEPTAPERALFVHSRLVWCSGPELTSYGIESDHVEDLPWLHGHSIGWVPPAVMWWWEGTVTYPYGREPVENEYPEPHCEGTIRPATPREALALLARS